MECLEDFCALLGQKVSSCETNIFFSKNVDEELRQNIITVCGFSKLGNMRWYLGILLVHGR